MYRSRLVTALAVTFGAMSGLFAVLATFQNLFIFVPAALFALVAYLMWYHATGRLASRLYRGAEAAATRNRRREHATPGDRRGGFGAGPRADREPPGEHRRGGQRSRGGERAGETPRGQRGRRRQKSRSPSAVGRLQRERAREILGVDADAGEDAITSAYRERIKETHPDTAGGNQDEFKRVRDAYETLTG